MNSLRLICTMLFISCTLAFAGCSGSDQGSADRDSTVYGKESKIIIQPEKDGSFLLSAENGTAIGPKIKYMPEWKAFGWFTSADKVEWLLEVPKTGAYEVELQWSVSDEEAGKEFALQTKNEILTGIVEKSGSWETYITKEIGLIKLEPGKQRIIFKPNTDFDSTGALLDLRSLKLKPADR